jgi:hypothetical protein
MLREDLQVTPQAKQDLMLTLQRIFKLTQTVCSLAPTFAHKKRLQPSQAASAFNVCFAAETVLLLCCRNRIAALLQKPYCCFAAETVLLQGELWLAPGDQTGPGANSVPCGAELCLDDKDQSFDSLHHDILFVLLQKELGLSPEVKQDSKLVCRASPTADISIIKDHQL